MAEQHIEFDPANTRSQDLLRNVKKIQDGMNSLRNHFASLEKMKTGDGSTANQFQEVVDQYGVETDSGTGGSDLERAKLLYDEMNSAINNSAALNQFLAIVG